MFRKFPGGVFAGALLLVPAAWAQVTHRIDLPPDSPVAVLKADFGNSNAVPRGGAYQVELRATLAMRNLSQKKIRSIVMTVQASDITAGGKGAVTLPSLNVAPNETFTVPIEMSLLRPMGAAQGRPGVEVQLDGVLFDDLTFLGPDTRNSRRTMTLWELEARRDRDYFKSVLAKGGIEALQQEVQLAIARQEGPRRPGVQMARGRSTAIDADKEVAFAFVDIPDAPVFPTSGSARVTANLARDPRIQVLNRSEREVEHVQLGWVVKDQQGREFLAASLGADVSIPPNQSVQVAENTELRLQQPVAIEGMTGFVSSVQFAGGSYWIPSRADLSAPGLRGMVAPSPEEQRLLQIYSRRGVDALIEELKKF